MSPARPSPFEVTANAIVSFVDQGDGIYDVRWLEPVTLSGDGDASYALALYAADYALWDTANIIAQPDAYTLRLIGSVYSSTDCTYVAVVAQPYNVTSATPLRLGAYPY